MDMYGWEDCAKGARFRVTIEAMYDDQVIDCRMATNQYLGIALGSAVEHCATGPNTDEEVAQVIEYLAEFESANPDSEDAGERARAAVYAAAVDLLNYYRNQAHRRKEAQ